MHVQIFLSSVLLVCLWQLCHKYTKIGYRADTSVQVNSDIMSGYQMKCSIFDELVKSLRNQFFFSTRAYSWMITLSSCLISQIISFILPRNEYGCVNTWTTLGSGSAIALQKMPILVSTGRRQVPHSQSYLRCFEDRIISRRTDVVWPPQSCDLTALNYYLWGALKDKFYADKPETI